MLARTYWRLLVLCLCSCSLIIAQVSDNGEGGDPIDGQLTNSFSDDELSDEGRLVEDLHSKSSKYKDEIRPVRNSSSTVKLTFGLTLLQILDFDEKNQMLTSLVWKDYGWLDEIHNWNVSDYGGVEFIVLPMDAIWTPDVLLYNNVGRSRAEGHKDKLVLWHNGSVKWVPPVIYQSSCPVDMKEYPFDTQTCIFKFGSWTYDTSRLLPVFYKDKAEADLREYVASSEWEVVGNEAVINKIKYACCANPYADITYTLRLKRNMTFHIRLILVPTILLSIMTVAIFWVPPQRPDRTGIGLSLFSSFFLLLILVVQSSPPTAATKLGQYYIVTILMVACGILLSVGSINICNLTRPVPRCIDKIFIPMFSWMVCGGRVKISTCCGCRNEVPHPSTQEQMIPLGLNRDQKETNKCGHPVQQNNLPALPAQKIKSNGERWRTLALIMDRIFFTCFVIGLSVSFIHIFPNPSMLKTLLY